MRLKSVGTLFLALVGASAFGAHGNEFIGVSAAGTAMGGTGVGHYTNISDALYRNPALLNWASSEEGFSDFELHLKLIKNNASANGGSGLKTSAAGLQPLPTLATHYRINDELSLGIGLLAAGGNVVDQSANTADLTGLKVSNVLYRVSPSAAYEVADSLSVSLTPVIAIGGLSLNESTSGSVSTRGMHYTAGLGFQLGAAYQPMEEWVVGLSYLSETNLTYKQIANLDAFGQNQANTALAGLDDAVTQQPQQIGVGTSYRLSKLTLALDYRWIQWSQADTFRSLGWQDQHVIAFGAQYSCEAWKFRAGVNYAKSPIRSATGEAGGTGVIFPGNHSLFQRSVSQLNLAAFPGVAETHLALGTSYEINSDVGVDVSFAYAPEVTVNRSGTLPPALGGTAYSFTAQASQWNIHGGVRLSL